jgi:hypothetical protein
MSLRLWTVGSKGEILRPTSLVVLPPGVSLEDEPDYVLSNTYAKTIGANLPRREVLLGLAASMAGCAVPLRPAQAVPALVAIGIAAVAIGASAIKVYRATFGSFEAKNDVDDRVKGYLNIKVTDDKTDVVEGSIRVFFTFPANTTATLRFDSGPAATTKGDKTLEVEADDSSDSATFEAV